MITTRIMPAAEQAYAYPLLIKRLLLSGVRYQPNQEIVYADKLRYTYTTLLERIQRLANVLTAAGSSLATPWPCSTGTAIGPLNASSPCRCWVRCCTQ